jgi:hypothetical protein
VKRHSLWIIVIVLVLAASAYSAFGVVKAHKKRKLAAETEAALFHYSQSLRPGLTRKEVEHYLQGQHTLSSERCCSVGRRAFSTSVKVGDDDTPWYCSEWPVYILFEFTAAHAQANGFTPPNPDDVLDQVNLGSNGEGCL